MKPDFKNLELTPEERELEQALASLQPAESGLDRESVFEAGEATLPVSPVRRTAGRRRRLTVGVAIGVVAACTLLVVSLVRLWQPSPTDGPRPGPQQIAVDPDLPKDNSTTGPVYIQMASAQIRPIGAARYEVLGPRRVRLDEGEMFVNAEEADEPLIIETPYGTASTQGSQSYVETQSSQSPNTLGADPMSTFRALTAVMILSGMVELSNPLGQVSGGPGELIAAEESAVPDKALPKTAIERLKPIIAQAIKDKAYPEAIKAIGQKIALEGKIQGGKPEEKIVRLQAEIAAVPEEMRPLMEAILAHWYWQYFQDYRWRFMERTATAQPAGGDILTWDLKRILAEIDKHFTAALAAETELKTIPISQYDALLAKADVPDTYRPTLYDFVAFEAISFYTAAEQAGAQAEDAFELTSDSPIFDPVDDFLGWRIETTDTNSSTVKAVAPGGR